MSSTDIPPSSDDPPQAATQQHPVVAFIDASALRVGLSPQGAGDLYYYHRMLHDPNTAILARIFKMSVQLKVLELLHASAADVAALKEKTEINAVAKALVFEPARVAFDNDTLRALIKIQLKTNPLFRAVAPVLDESSTVSKNNVNLATGRGASYAKSHLRNHYIQSKKMSATEAARSGCRKMLGNGARLDAFFLLRVIEMRMFNRANPDLVAELENENDAQEEADEETQTSTRSTKRKKKPAKGRAYWDAYQQHLEAKNQEYGSTYKAVGWVRELRVGVLWEYQHFDKDTLTLLPPEYKQGIIPMVEDSGRSTPIAPRQGGPANGISAPFNSQNTFATPAPVPRPLALHNVNNYSPFNGAGWDTTGFTGFNSMPELPGCASPLSSFRASMGSASS
ncbi:hypothetical protein MKEN_00195100 [Mycena kentingensis (nom. inval.)]|nr:hypothetical protein MKEN_00195100 [Mycena kentingensis (nom. inval.)]